MSDLLARYAEATFWMARYMERAENLARIVDVNETFMREHRGGRGWDAIVRLNADDERFYADRPAATGEAVLDFYILDQDNPTSIISDIRMARENARTLRPLISTEMWSHLNRFYSWLQLLTRDEIAPQRLNRLCSAVKEWCQTHSGIVEGTFYRDQGWYFYNLGKYLERADQTTRQLDIKYHTLLPSPADVGSPLDVSQWNALLRSVAGYHAYRRIHPRGMSPPLVAGFLLFNGAFPRSVAQCIGQVFDHLTSLRVRFALAGGNEAMQRIDEIRAELVSRPIERVIADGLHEFLDWTQSQLIALSGDVGRAFFGHRKA